MYFLGLRRCDDEASFEWFDRKFTKKKILWETPVDKCLSILFLVVTNIDKTLFNLQNIFHAKIYIYKHLETWEFQIFESENFREFSMSKRICDLRI